MAFAGFFVGRWQRAEKANYEKNLVNNRGFRHAERQWLSVPDASKKGCSSRLMIADYIKNVNNKQMFILTATG